MFLCSAMMVHATIMGYGGGLVDTLSPGQQAIFQVHLDAPYNVTADYSGGVSYQRWCTFGLVANDSTVISGNQMVSCENSFDTTLAIIMPSDVRKSYALVTVMLETKQVVQTGYGWVPEYTDRVIANETLPLKLGDVPPPPVEQTPTLSAVLGSIWTWFKGLFNWL